MMRLATSRLSTGLCAAGLLAGCNVTQPANVAQNEANGQANAVAAPRALRLRPAIVSTNLVLDPRSEVDTIIATAAATIQLPPTEAVDDGRAYIVNAQGGAVRLQTSRGDRILGASNLLLQRGQSVMLVKAGRGTWLQTLN